MFTHPIAPLFSTRQVTCSLDTPEFPDTVVVTDTPKQKNRVIPALPPHGTKVNPRTGDSTRNIKDSADSTFEAAPKIYTESAIPPRDAFDTVLIIPFNIKTSCYELRNELTWDMEAIDSNLKQPSKLFLHYRPFVKDSSAMVDSLRTIDSNTVHSKGVLWVVSGGTYTLSYFDKKQRILFKSEELEVSGCAAYEIPEVFDVGESDLLKPTQLINVEKVDMSIFSSSGEEVFTTTDPGINWDGRNKNTGLKCDPGNYFFNCDIYEKKGNRIVKKNITGVIELRN